MTDAMAENRELRAACVSAAATAEAALARLQRAEKVITRARLVAAGNRLAISALKIALAEYDEGSPS